MIQSVRYAGMTPISPQCESQSGVGAGHPTGAGGKVSPVVENHQGKPSRSTRRISEELRRLRRSVTRVCLVGMLAGQAPKMWRMFSFTSVPR